MRNIRKKLLHLTVPITLVGLLDKVANVISILFLVQLGHKELAASILGFNTFVTVLTIAVTSLYSVSILTSHAVGKGDNAAVGVILRSGFLVSILLSVPCTLVLWHAGVILQIFHQDPELIRIAIPYFHYSALSILPTQLGMVLVQFYLGISKPRITLTRAIICFPFFIAFSYIFILGKFGFPQMGLGGMAAAVLIVRILSFLMLLGYLLVDKSIKKYQLFDFMTCIDFSVIKQILKVGIPIGMQISGELAAMTVAVYMLGHFGVTALAAGQIVAQYIILVFMIILGLSQATSVVISQAYAENNGKLVNDYKKASFFMIHCLSIFVLVLFALCGKLLMMPFINMHDPSNAQLIKYTYIFFAIAGITMYVDGVRNILTSCLRGLHSSSYPMLVGVICLWFISLPTCYVLAYTMHGGAIALRIGFISGFIIAVYLLSRSFKKKQQMLLGG